MAIGRPRLSAFLIVHNEERNLGDCLASLRDLADEVVVLDDGSSDSTVEIARAAGARVEYRPFDGYGMQKQAALNLARGEWVLSLDADERITPKLADEIRGIVAEETPRGVDGYWVRRELIYLGTRLRFGGTGRDWVLRLARRVKAHVSPRIIHEHLAVAGPTRRLRGTIRHIKYQWLSEHISVIDRQTTVIAAERAQRGLRFHAWHLLRVPWELFARLVLRVGILDGLPGIIYATMASYYAFLKYAKLWPRVSRNPRR
jgi:glycosyltransferase involved in cell wall biosynthesis